MVLVGLPVVGDFERSHLVTRTQRFVADACRRYPDAQVDFVGHSLGTYLGFNAMTQPGGPRSFFRRVALMATSVSSREPFLDEEGHFEKVLNLYSRRDEVIRFDPLGQAGWCGFRREDDRVHSEEVPGYTHGDYTHPGVAWGEVRSFLSAPDAPPV